MGDDLAYRMADYVLEVSVDSEDSTHEEFAEELASQYFFGDACARPKAADTTKMDSWNDTVQFLKSQGIGMDLG